MKAFLCRLWRRDEGGELVEWIIVAAVLIAVAAGSYVLLGNSINYAVNDVGEKVNSAVGNGADAEEGDD